VSQQQEIEQEFVSRAELLEDFEANSGSRSQIFWNVLERTSGFQDC
jgi:hypothetical protein